jgi:hypothetical protein
MAQADGRVAPAITGYGEGETSTLGAIDSGAIDAGAIDAGFTTSGDVELFAGEQAAKAAPRARMRSRRLIMG